ncbi:unnamed protein product [Bursaphelenchus xylophilus]|uniref:(pine wood nematode) hypothetical protein n=1 Tax=Bursaphelenchus xylophilus TaxID=6326 RepID=A0A1I7S0C0_BURXY|nr:unnamed protein product [Bursaphelenchus xylophilus]CAG9132191.1 unnamed protein product [Bursaphelenchus xylophilus]
MAAGFHVCPEAHQRTLLHLPEPIQCTYRQEPLLSIVVAISLPMMAAAFHVCPEAQQRTLLCLPAIQ